jgi:23S rRNA pseudouridine1911/1915/1917 synthase
MSLANVHLVDDSLAGKTVLATLRHWQPGLSWSEARRLLAARQIAVNGMLCQDEARRLRTNDVVEVSGRAWPPATRRDDISLQFRDEHLVVVEKPAGLLTELSAAARTAHRHGRPRTPTLDAILPRVIAEYEGRRPRRDADRIFIVHRLDRDASGLLVVARTPEARDALARQFAARTPSRVYWAIVPGQIEAQTIRSHFVRDRGDGKRGSVSPGAAEKMLVDSHSTHDPSSTIRLPQLAITHVRPMSSRRGQSLVECRLETGRTNQIRIHLAELGHPICGDVKYGPALHSSEPPTPPIADHPTPLRLALHAIELSFMHPITGEDLHFVSELPPELERFWGELPTSRRFQRRRSLD